MILPDTLFKVVPISKDYNSFICKALIVGTDWIEIHDQNSPNGLNQITIDTERYVYYSYPDEIDFTIKLFVLINDKWVELITQSFYSVNNI